MGCFLLVTLKVDGTEWEIIQEEHFKTETQYKSVALWEHTFLQ